MKEKDTTGEVKISAPQEGFQLLWRLQPHDTANFLISCLDLPSSQQEIWADEMIPMLIWFIFIVLIALLACLAIKFLALRIVLALVLSLPILLSIGFVVLRRSPVADTNVSI